MTQQLADDELLQYAKGHKRAEPGRVGTPWFPWWVVSELTCLLCGFALVRVRSLGWTQGDSIPPTLTCENFGAGVWACVGIANGRSLPRSTRGWSAPKRVSDTPQHLKTGGAVVVADGHKLA
jgi:hypothetical protein